ncbi:MULTISPECIES: hypothetical protein [unclassified Clostridium]|uniref:hypothetical protein n=1 Tax=unclassified Clostridium TaxID=2614128 RepID=UPI0032166166
MAKTKGKIKELELPTLKLMKKQDAISWENVNGEAVKRHYVVPEYIIKNLKHLLRPYQQEAIRYFHYSQQLNGSDELYNHLLFNMATGERVIIVTGCINILISRVSGTLTKYYSYIA